MKFRFKIQDYQTAAVNSVVDVFKGQPMYTGISYRRDVGMTMQTAMQLTAGDDPLVSGDTGFRNGDIALTEADLLENIRQVQGNNGLEQSPGLIKVRGVPCLDVEMETGTGKTYVYIKTMFELNRLYGWCKFVVVVPSIAIREGVKKSFEITQDHFMETYQKKARYFVYDSKNLNQLDAFSADGGINVMIVNAQAFTTSLNEDGKSKESLIINSLRDEFGSRKPIDVIAANRPIVILDEPQKLGGAATQKSLASFKALFQLNYSATHMEKHNMVYVLDALDAYNKRLVKRIEVKGFEVRNLRGTTSYLYIESFVLSKDAPPQVRLECEVKRKNGIKREIHKVSVGDNLYNTSKEMEQYKEGFTLKEIDPLAGTVTLLNGLTIRKGEVVGDTTQDTMRRVQIRETLRSHFEKEQQLFAQGIKCLSLFFIDEVARYRQYDETGSEQLGEYGLLFEAEYETVLQDMMGHFDPAYQAYLRAIAPGDTHRGYFSIDKKTGRAVDSTLKRGSEFSDDLSAYDLILKNKERLLSFDEPTRFIFSHSALREGWDNPNVFQICTLKHGGDSITSKRQEVGRGLRLCVNQAGDRMDENTLGDQVQAINTLTVIASEAYATFVDDLQKQTLKELRHRPQKANAAYFTGKHILLPDGRQEIITPAQADKICFYLVKNDYVDEDQRVTETYRTAVNTDTLAPMTEALRPIEAAVHKLVQAIFDQRVLDEMIRDGNKTKAPDNPLNERFYKAEFQALWKAIHHKHFYTVDFDSRQLIASAIGALDERLSVTNTQYVMTVAGQRAEITGEQMEQRDSFEAGRRRTEALLHGAVSTVKYDLVGKIAQGTTLTRRTVADILKGIAPETFALYRRNPEEFIAQAIHLIMEEKATAVVEHISYTPAAEVYHTDIFTVEKQSRTLDQAFLAKKAVQDYVFTDGTAEKSVERRFVEQLESAVEVNVYAKLPRGFAIPTPMGNYAPDWAIVFTEGTVKHVYFVAETKGTMDSLNLKPIEKAKIDCAKKLFSALAHGMVKYDQVDSFETLMNKVMG